MVTAEGVVVRRVLREARWMVGQPRQLDDAIGVLDELSSALDVPLQDTGPALQRLRTVLATHLLAVHVLREVAASEETVARAVRRAIDGVELAVPLPAG
jgi:hypothetical protein